MRKIATVRGPFLPHIATNRSHCRIYFDYGNSEYVVHFCPDGVHRPAADYHTDDLDDAAATAEAMLTQHFTNTMSQEMK